MSHFVKKCYQAVRKPLADQQTNLLFIWMPKVAGTSIFRMLRDSKYCCQRLLDREKNGVLETSSVFQNRGAVTFGHTSVDALLDNKVVTQEYLDSAFKFCFVRNPWDRLVSLYFYLRFSEQYGDFRSFCLAFKEQEITPIGVYNVRGNSQCNEQVSWLLRRDGRLLVDFIGRFERLDEDTDRLRKMLGIRETLVHKNRSKGRSVAVSYRDYYDDETIEIVRAKYKRDIDFFGYDF